jgi:hypothetical protein
VGANVAQRWNDFRHFSRADQAFFQELLPEIEDVDFNERDMVDPEPGGGGSITPVEILEESDVRAAELQPIGDPEVMEMFRILAERGITPEQAAQGVQRVRQDRQDVRRARQEALHERVQNETGSVLGRLGISAVGKTLDRARRLQNFAWTASELNRRVDATVNGELGNRQNFTLAQLNAAHDALPEIVAALERELRNG